MAKSDSFFIRAKVQTNGTTFAQQEIDLGSFVNLGVSKSTLLRIHRIDHQWRDSVDPGQAAFDQAANAQACYVWQLTTQSQTALVTMDDKSVVASGSLICGNSTSTAGDLDLLTDVTDVAPQEFTQGYLVGVDSMFLGVDCSIAPSNEIDCCIIMECTLDREKGMEESALALSQQ
jgi:hypothetical protein